MASRRPFPSVPPRKRARYSKAPIQNTRKGVFGRAASNMMEQTIAEDTAVPATRDSFVMRERAGIRPVEPASTDVQLSCGLFVNRMRKQQRTTNALYIKVLLNTFDKACPPSDLGSSPCIPLCLQPPCCRNQGMCFTREIRAEGRKCGALAVDGKFIEVRKTGNR